MSNSPAPSLTNRWVFPDAIEAAAAENLAAALSIHPLAATILAQRLENPTAEIARAFIEPNLANLLPPQGLPDIDLAAERIARAIANKERIVVYGDYDSDGVNATAVLVHVFRALGHPVRYYLPSRMDEGYGVSTEFVARAIEKREYDLVITVDCGTADSEPVRQLMDAGIDVIITDHHEIGSADLPPALAVVNPKRADSTYAFPGLVGTGVAYKLAWAVCEKVHGSKKLSPVLKSALLSVLPLVGVATVTDVGPLLGENRVLVYYALRGYRHAPPGALALAEVAGVKIPKISVRDFGFGLGPRLNAAGRMGDADLALRLLIAQDRQMAKRFAQELDIRNNDRRELCRAIEEEALAEVLRTHDLNTDAAIVVAHEDWHEGVIGIVASRLVGEFKRPALVISLTKGGDTGKGSARSVRGIDLFAAMSASQDRFVRFGGHEQAAGCTIKRDEITALRVELQAACAAQAAAKNVEPELRLDAELSLAEITPQLVRDLARLEPFGSQNPKPVFLAREITVTGEPRLMGSHGKHFSFNATQDGTVLRAIVFNNTRWLTEIDGGQTRWDIAFTCEENDYYNPPRYEIRIEDMRPAS